MDSSEVNPQGRMPSGGNAVTRLKQDRQNLVRLHDVAFTGRHCSEAPARICLHFHYRLESVYLK